MVNFNFLPSIDQSIDAVGEMDGAASVVMVTVPAVQD